MIKSFFLDMIGHLQGVVTAVVKKYNGKNDEGEVFLYQNHLDKKLSIDGRWTSITGMFKRVVADYVAIGSPATLKSRGSKGVATGEIPKISSKYQLDESQFENIQEMQRRGVEVKAIITELFQDARTAVLNVFRRNDMSFLDGLCNGVISAGRDTSKGTEVRANFGYLEENKFNVQTAEKIEEDDIQAIIDKAITDGNRITTLFLDNTSLKRLRNSASLRQSFANNAGIVLSNGGDYPVLNTQKVKELFLSEWGINLVTGVDKTFQIEENGLASTYKPWKDGIMIFSTSPTVGSLIYSYTVEHTQRQKQADYAEADYILVSKYGSLDPLVEFTKAEAKCLPVISNVEGIYRLDSNIAKG